MKNNKKKNNLKSKEEIVMIENFNNSIKEYFKGDSNFITATWHKMTESVFDLLGDANRADKCITLEFKDINTNPDYFTVLGTFFKNECPYSKTKIMFGDGHTMLILIYR